MSIRIHELAKRHNLDGKDMLSLLRERGYVSADTKSVSSTIANIYVEEIDKEFAAKAAAEAPVVVAVAAPAPVVPEAPVVRLPPGVFVKSASDVVREKEEAAKAAAAARAVDCAGRVRLRQVFSLLVLYLHENIPVLTR